MILEQRAQVTVLVTLVSTILANTRDSIRFYVLASLRYIDRVRDYPYKNLGLVCAYCYFSNVSQLVTHSFNGLLVVWEVIFFLIFISFMCCLGQIYL